MQTRESFFQAVKPKTKSVEIPEWGGSVTIRQLSAHEIATLSNTKHDDHEAGARSIAASVIDENGQLMFTEADIPEIQKASAAGTIRLNRAINDFNGLGPDLAKN